MLESCNRFSVKNIPPIIFRFSFYILYLSKLKIIPSFVQLTQHTDKSLRQQLAFRSAALSTVVLLLVRLVGQNMVHVW